MSPLVTFAELFDLQQSGDGVFVGGNMDNPWGRVYGGQVAAQALFAAGCTTDPGFVPHSLHTTFIRAGSFDEPVHYDVQRIRDGRSFATRQVIARQSHGVLLQASASFQLAEDGPDLTFGEPPAIPEPDSLEVQDWTPVFNRRGTEDGAAILLWLRLAERLGHDDPLLHAVGITLLSDDAPMEAAERVHPIGAVDYRDPKTIRPYYGATLNHAIWFHRPARADEWGLHRVGVSGLGGGRAHMVGEVWSSAGCHVASLAQEVLLREVRA